MVIQRSNGTNKNYARFKSAIWIKSKRQKAKVSDRKPNYGQKQSGPMANDINQKYRSQAKN